MSQSLHWRGRTAGFTFIELLVTLAILATLAWMAVPMIEVAVQRNKEKELRSALAEIRGAIDAYKHAVDQGRIKTAPGESGYPLNLDVLVEGVSDQKSVDRKMLYFLRRVPRDPFNSDSAQGSAASWGLRSYASPPEEPREGEDVFDVFSRSEKTGLNGLPYRQW